MNDPTESPGNPAPETVGQALETDMLEQTVGGIVSLFLETMSVQLPPLSDKMTVMRATVQALCEETRPARPWEIELAGALAWVGLLLTPRTIVEKVENGHRLTEAEWTTFRNYHQVGADMIRKIPRLQMIGDYVGSIGDLKTDGNPPRNREARLAQDILTIASDAAWLWRRMPFDQLAQQVLDHVKGPRRELCLQAFRKLGSGKLDQEEILFRPCDTLLPGDTILEDLHNERGEVVLSRGHQLTPSLTRKLRILSKQANLDRQVRIMRPALHTPKQDRHLEQAYI